MGLLLLFGGGNTSVAGAQATATASGNAGTVNTGPVNIVGVQATATAAGLVGSVRIRVTGVQAAATAAGVPGALQATVIVIRPETSITWRNLLLDWSPNDPDTQVRTIKPWQRQRQMTK